MNSKDKSKEKPSRKFHEEWLSNEEFKDWLKPDKIDATKFRCFICNVSQIISTSGKTALSKHAKNLDHEEKVKKRQNFFKAAKEKAPEDEPQEKVLELAVDPGQPLLAVIRLILKCVESGFSSRSCDNMGELMRMMFPDSKNAQSLTLGKDKFAYILNHGIFPYFRECLITSIKKSEIHVFSFDESLNEKTESCEMDVYIRYWDTAEKEVKVRYLGSSFFGHGTHQNLIKNFEDIITGLDRQKAYQISMDGPNVNLKFLKEIKKMFGKTNLHQLIDIGVCSLHAVHGAFETGEKKSLFAVSKVMKGSYYLLKDTPARREDYESLTGSTKYPVAHCSVRWVENKKAG